MSGRSALRRGAHRRAHPQASSGNPGLVPIQSENLDLSFEWYYKEGSYAAVGYFHKDTKNFIGNRFLSGVELFPNLTSPNVGGLADIAPTVLELLGIPQPPVMTGRSLILKKGLL